MKNLRNFYFIVGLFAIAFAILTRLIPAFNSGLPLFHFTNGFCWGLGITMLIAGIITAFIPYFYRREKKKTDGATDATADQAAVGVAGTEAAKASDHKDEAHARPE